MFHPSTIRDLGEGYLHSEEEQVLDAGSFFVLQMGTSHSASPTPLECIIFVGGRRETLVSLAFCRGP